jgi:alpha-beta hydrolase superfamily lysophospholipase
VQIISKILPRMKIYGMIPGSMDAVKPDSCAEAKEPTRLYAGKNFSAAFYAALLKEMRRGRKYLVMAQNFPSLVIYGEDDLFASHKSVESVFTNAFHGTQNLKLCLCKHCGHRIFHEKERLDFVERITKWIHKQETGV